MKTAKVSKAALGAIEADDMPALAAAYNVGVSRDYCPPLSKGGCRRDAMEEAAEAFGLVDAGDDWEFPELDENGLYAFYDDYDRFQAKVDVFLAGRGPHPDTI